MQDHNIFRCKIYSESSFFGFNFILHTHIPVYKYSKYPPGGRAKHFVVDIDCFANINLCEGCTMKYRVWVVASVVISFENGRDCAGVKRSLERSTIFVY